LTGVASGERLFFPTATPNSFVSLAAGPGPPGISGCCPLTIASRYAPALLAKLLASVCRVSDGRFALGVGVGGEYPLEFVAAESHRRARRSNR